MGIVFKVFYQVDCEQEASSVAKFPFILNHSEPNIPVLKSKVVLLAWNSFTG